MSEFSRSPDAATIEDADELRAQLDALNDAGVDYRLSGLDARLQPFLAMLSGAYAESIQVILGDPWDGEVEWNTGTHCDECNASELHAIEHLNFPVTVLGLLIPGGAS